MTLIRGSAVRRNDMEKFFDLFWKHPKKQPPNAPPAAPPLTPALAWVWSVA